MARVGEVARACRRAKIVDVRAQSDRHGVSRLGYLDIRAVHATFVRAHGIGRLSARPSRHRGTWQIEETDSSWRRVRVVAETSYEDGGVAATPGDRRIARMRPQCDSGGHGSSWALFTP